MATGPLVQTRGLSKSYGALKALQSVDLDVPEGRVGLLGPNGAGKTTLLKVLLGLLEFEAGTVTVLGQSTKKDPRVVRAQVGYMPERDVYLPGMTAVEMCSYAGRLCGLPPTQALRRSHEALNFVGLEDKRYQLVDSYSTGQRQRVKLAAALVHDPKFLLLDEPTNGLDPEGRDAMLDLIASLPDRRGLSFVLSTHLLPDVERVCDHVLLLDGGKLVRSTTLNTMRQGHEGLWQVRPKANQEEALALALEAVACQVQRKDRTLFIGLPPKTTTRLILETALAAGLQVRHMAPYRRSLQDAFMEAVGHDELTDHVNGPDTQVGEPGTQVDGPGAQVHGPDGHVGGRDRHVGGRDGQPDRSGMSGQPTLPSQTASSSPNVPHLDEHGPSTRPVTDESGGTVALEQNPGQGAEAETAAGSTPKVDSEPKTKAPSAGQDREHA